MKCLDQGGSAPYLRCIKGEKPRNFKNRQMIVIRFKSEFGTVNHELDLTTDLPIIFSADNKLIVTDKNGKHNFVTPTDIAAIIEVREDKKS